LAYFFITIHNNHSLEVLFFTYFAICKDLNEFLEQNRKIFLGRVVASPVQKMDL
jgi:hypothetical protein